MFSIKTNILTFKKRRCMSLDTPPTYTMLNSLLYSVMIMQRPLASKLCKLILFIKRKIHINWLLINKVLITVIASSQRTKMFFGWN